eukprot:6492399-Amphidinium_carterae.2
MYKNVIDITGDPSSSDGEGCKLEQGRHRKAKDQQVQGLKRPHCSTGSKDLDTSGRQSQSILDMLDPSLWREPKRQVKDGGGEGGSKGLESGEGTRSLPTNQRPEARLVGSKASSPNRQEEGDAQASDLRLVLLQRTEVLQHGDYIDMHSEPEAQSSAKKNCGGSAAAQARPSPAELGRNLEQSYVCKCSLYFFMFT